MSANDQGQGSTTETTVSGPTEIVLSAAPSLNEVIKAPVADITDVETKPEVKTEADPKSDENSDTDPNARDDKGRFKGKGLQDRIDELTRSRREAEREAAYWKSRAAGTVSAQSPALPAAPIKPPVASDFETEAEFIEALTDYKVEEKLSKRENQAKAVQAVTERATSWQSRLEAARTAIPDFNTVMDSAEMPVANHVADLLLEHDSGAELAYHFAQNPDILSRVNSMTSVKAAFEIAKIATSIEKSASPDTTTKEVPVEKPTSKAPAPPKPVGQGRSATPKVEDMSMEEYKSFRKREGATWAR